MRKKRLVNEKDSHNIKEQMISFTAPAKEGALTIIYQKNGKAHCATTLIESSSKEEWVKAFNEIAEGTYIPDSNPVTE